MQVGTFCLDFLLKHLHALRNRCVLPARSLRHTFQNWFNLLTIVHSNTNTGWDIVFRILIKTLRHALRNLCVLTARSLRHIYQNGCNLQIIPRSNTNTVLGTCCLFLFFYRKTNIEYVLDLFVDAKHTPENVIADVVLRNTLICLCPHPPKIVLFEPQE